MSEEKAKLSAKNIGGRFLNPDANIKPKNLLAIFKWAFTSQSKAWPEKVNAFKDSPPANVGDRDVRISSVGHATFLIQLANLNILTDPVWSKRASPVSFAGPKRVTQPGVDLEKLPHIDLILVSHNHYDHLDIDTLKSLWHVHHPCIVVPLGNAKVIKQAIPKAKIIELNWYESFSFKSAQVHLVPSQHWSSRTVIDRNKALWGGFIIDAPQGQVCFVGDSGYSQEMFQTIAQHFSNILFAILPIGSYEPRWFMGDVHMNPQDAINAYKDLNAKFFIPSHFGVFKLTDESYHQQLLDYENAIKSSDVKEENMLILHPGEFVLRKF